MNEFILSLFKYTSILICVLYTYTKLSHLKLKVSDLAAIPLFIALSAVLHFTTLHIKILVPTGILILSSAFLYLRFKRPIQETVMVNIIAFAISIAFFIFSIGVCYFVASTLYHIKNEIVKESADYDQRACAGELSHILKRFRLRPGQAIVFGGGRITFLKKFHF